MIYKIYQKSYFVCWLNTRIDRLTSYNSQILGGRTLGWIRVLYSRVSPWNGFFCNFKPIILLNGLDSYTEILPHILLVGNSYMLRTLVNLNKKWQPKFFNFWGKVMAQAYLDTAQFGKIRSIFAKCGPISPSVEMYNTQSILQFTLLVKSIVRNDVDFQFQQETHVFEKLVKFHIMYMYFINKHLNFY